MSVLQYSKTPGVKHPERGTPKAAGVDFFMPEFTPEFINTFHEKNPCVHTIYPGLHSHYVDEVNKKILLGPGQKLLIPSGVRVLGNAGTANIFFNKSGIGAKKGLDVLACVVDEDYRGIIHINLVNTTSYIVEICEGEKIIQLVELPVGYPVLQEITEEELTSNTSERGEGGFGSTDKK